MIQETLSGDIDSSMILIIVSVIMAGSLSKPQFDFTMIDDCLRLPPMIGPKVLRVYLVCRSHPVWHPGCHLVLLGVQQHPGRGCGCRCSGGTPNRCEQCEQWPPPR